MLYVTSAGRKFEITPERLAGRRHAEKRESEHQREENADDTDPVHASDLYNRPSSSSITSTQVVTDGRELTAMPRLLAMS